MVGKVSSALWSARRREPRKLLGVVIEMKFKAEPRM
jgi:hypothetical protein